MTDQLETKTYPKRTKQQNKALHVLFNLLAEQLNDVGLDMRKTLEPHIAIPWSGRAVKEYLWRPVMKQQLVKASTTQMTTVEIDQVFDTLMRFLAMKHGFEGVNFPSVEELIYQYEERERLKRQKERKK